MAKLVIMVDDHSLQEAYRRSATSVLVESLPEATIEALVDYIVLKKLGGSSAEWICDVYDVSQYSLPISMPLQVPGTLPTPLFPPALISDALSNPSAAIHFYISCIPESHLRERPPSISSPSAWTTFMTESPIATHAPSSVAKEPHTHQASPAHRIWNDRPDSEPGMTPIALLYQPFGKFQDISKGIAADGVELVDETVLRTGVLQLAAAGRDFYPDETARRLAMLPFIDNIFESHRDSALWPTLMVDHDTSPLGAVTTLVEFRNEFLDITSEAEYEAAAYATQSHAAASKIFPEVYRAFRMPTLMLTVHGANICFYALLILQRPRIVELTPILSLRHDSVDSRPLDTLSAAFRAACVLRADINRDVADMLGHTRQSSRPLLKPQFPSSTHCTSCSDPTQTLTFTLVQRFQELNNRLLFLAELDNDNRKVLVKYSLSYSAPLHQLCHSLGHAPELLGHEILPGGWHQIVMEYIPDAPCLAMVSMTDVHRQRAYAKMKSLADAFHAQGYVHGDLRTANILACHGWEQDLTKLSLVDFDWGGLAGEARYPTPLLIGELLNRPMTTLDDLVIRVEDDLAVLAKTFKVL
ncbi:hypothetical protein GGX14DRAFT_456552 [Mycena pura]|uniref:Protein kinase domain-containing protein n=1 Tax=Mycena pura TaxID=153505 RepID=A0AAD6VE57_9AGAR|nr:hypothetical protein GGX14DRAFT_456552 [Mycena pura]